MRTNPSSRNTTNTTTLNLVRVPTFDSTVVVENETNTTSTYSVCYAVYFKLNGRNPKCFILVLWKTAIYACACVAG